MEIYTWKTTYPDGEIEYVDCTVRDFFKSISRLQKLWGQNLDFEIIERVV